MSTRQESYPVRSHQRRHPWEAYEKDLMTEFTQCMDEGKDMEPYRALFDAAARLPDSAHKAALGDVLFDIVEAAPQRDGYPYYEPSDYEDIVAASAAGRGEGTGGLTVPDDAVRHNKNKGALYGRICGCLLGKCVEGIRYDELTRFPKATVNYPMYRYIARSDLNKINVSDYGFPLAGRIYPNGPMPGMPVDDDTNYIILAHILLRDKGRDFTPADVADVWLRYQPKDAYCTAERAAFRNFVDGFLPPDSARYKNPYREWIGAQIRGDWFGWCNPADPTAAASMAWRDACISHVKNGIYGEMWVAAMLAAVAGGADIETGIRIGMEHIPTQSRLHEALMNVLGAFRGGMSANAFFEDLHRRWDDRNGHHWCHTVSNAEIVAASLLWGGGDYAASVGMAVEQGFDTDCNGATVGSVVGMAIGFDAIPAYWTNKISGKLFTSIFGFETVSVDELAEKI